MPWKVDAPGCDCCGCERVVDDFATDTISNYQQLSGTWSVSDGHLSTGNDNALIKATTTGLLYQKLFTQFKSVGRKTVKLVGGLSSAFQYIYAQVEFDTSGTCGWLEIRSKLPTGTDTRLGDRVRLQNLDPAKTHAVSLCVLPNDDLSGAALYAQAGGGECVVAEMTTTPSVGAGLGTGSGGSDDVEFSLFSWSDSKSPTNECPSCGCHCLSSFDFFNRADSDAEPVGADDIGCLWSVCHNFWKIQNRRLVGWADANVKHLQPLDPRAKNQYASVDVQGEDGTKALLYLGYDCDASMCAVVEFSAAYNKSKIAISNDNGSSYYNGWQYIDTSGMRTAGPGEAGFIPGAWYGFGGHALQESTQTVTLQACIRNGKFYASAKGKRISAGAGSAGDAPFAGLGVRYHDGGSPETGIRKPVFFDNFQAGRGGVPCGQCDLVANSGGVGCVNCQYYSTPDTMLVTEPDLTGSCQSCDTRGGKYLLPFVGQSEDEACCEWAGVPASGCAATETNATLQLCHNDSDGYFLKYTSAAYWFGTAVETHVWKGALGSTKPDCKTINETLALDSTAGDCTATGTTVTVRAL